MFFLSPLVQSINDNHTGRVLTLPVAHARRVETGVLANDLQLPRVKSADPLSVAIRRGNCGIRLRRFSPSRRTPELPLGAIRSCAGHSGCDRAWPN